MKCTWQDGGKYCEGGKVAYAPCSEDVGPLVTENDCPACNGTGEAELDADQAAEYLKDTYREIYYEYWAVEATYKVFRIIWVDTKSVGPQTVSSFELLGEGPTLTAALNAAAIKERGKE